MLWGRYGLLASVQAAAARYAKNDIPITGIHRVSATSTVGSLLGTLRYRGYSPARRIN